MSQTAGRSLEESSIPQRFDLIVVGAGSGGYAAARTARDLGAHVAMVDPGPLGGLCILRGCMPSKTLLATGDLLHDITANAKELAIDAPAPALDYPALAARKRRLVQGWADYRIAGIETFPLLRGPAQFESPTTLRVGSEVLYAPRFVIGTGSLIAPAAVTGLAEAGYIDSDAALDLEEPPKSLIVLGGGYVGAELGQFFHRAGVPTTMLIRSQHLLSHEDSDVGLGLTEYFRAEGIRVETGARVERVTVRDGMKVVTYRQDGEDREVAAHEIFYALGRVPNVDGLGLEKAGVEYHEITGITVDDTLRTTNPNIFAVGDVTGRYALVHVAIQQGEIAGRNAATGAHERADYRITKTHTVFTDPQVAVVGETEKELEAAGIPFLRATYPFDDHGKAVALNKTKGFVKMLASPHDGTILGASILGPDASDLIQPLIVAMSYGATVDQYARIPHLHPTLVEILTYPAEEIAEQLKTAPALAVAK